MVVMAKGVEELVELMRWKEKKEDKREEEEEEVVTPEEVEEDLMVDVVEDQEAEEEQALLEDGVVMMEDMTKAIGEKLVMKGKMTRREIHAPEEKAEDLVVEGQEVEEE